MPDPKSRSANPPSTTVSSDNATKVEGDKDGRSGSTVGYLDKHKHHTTARSDLKTQLQDSGTWYKGGTWRRGSKATPVTQVAKESIFAATEKASELVTTARNPIKEGILGAKPSPSTYLCRSIGTPSRSSSLDAPLKKKPSETTSSRTLHETIQEPIVPTALPAPGKDSTVPQEALQENPIPKTENDQNPPVTADSRGPEVHNSKANTDASLWRAWFSRHEEPPKQEPKPPEAIKALNQSTTGPIGNPIQRRVSNPELATTTQDRAAVPRSWLGLWSAARPARAEPVSAAASATTKTSANKLQLSSGSDTPEIKAEASNYETQPTSTAKSSGWAFWSRGITEDGGSNPNAHSVGKLALAGSPSQSHPESAVLDEAPRILRTRPRSVGSSQKLGTSQPQRPKAPKEVSVEPDGKSTRNRHIENDSHENGITKNLLLPRMTSTYRPVERPSFMQSLSRLWQYNNSSSTSQVKLSDSPPRLKRALAIGVHGYFPAPLIRSVLGQPTGTSIRFADGAANAIHKWTEAQGYSCDIEKVALEGEGKILERVELLWKLLLNWIDNIRRADFIMVACHSQGVPVAIMLIAKLIESGYVQGAKIGVCAMAGVNQGPFVDYKSRWIGGSARELFDFAEADSQVSKDYSAALTTILSSGVRVAYVGSIDDQLVSLDSSTFGTVDHPNVYRAVFVDGRVHAPDFLTHLVGFALKLRNLGVSDHGLIRELSSPLAGSLYSGEGHSRIYEDEAVYYLGVQNALEITTVSKIPLKKIREDTSSSQNPYILPFSLRGVLEENHVKTELQKETMELLQQFDDWKPSTKILKDVKFRLEGVRSKL
ncbi:MAG: hypothetical protein Q9178_003539 [Gyalolechia marmorata]